MGIVLQGGGVCVVGGGSQKRPTYSKNVMTNFPNKRPTIETSLGEVDTYKRDLHIPKGDLQIHKTSDLQLRPLSRRYRRTRESGVIQKKYFTFD